MNNQHNKLIQKAKSGNKQAFAQLLEIHYELMFRIAFKWCGDRADAEDITQNACLKLARGIGSFRFDASFSSWLYRLVLNVAIDWQRANKRQHLPLPDNLPSDPGDDAERQLQNRQELARVLALPEKEKTALLLVFSEGMTHAEAAAVMNCKEGTVSWYIHEARKRLGAHSERSARHA